MDGLLKSFCEFVVKTFPDNPYDFSWSIVEVHPDRIEVQKTEESMTYYYQRDWNNPQVACSLLSHIKGFQAGTYKKGDFFCCSPYKVFNSESILSNDIAFYAEGDAEVVHIIKTRPQRTRT